MFAAVAATALAQAPPPETTSDVEVDPISCWWRTTTRAVRAGEPFGLTLTCSVVETESTKVVPDLSRLDPAVVQLPPFEILSGTHAGDITVPGKRFLQYRLQAARDRGGQLRRGPADPHVRDLLPHRKQGAGRRLGAGPRHQLLAAEHVDPADLARARATPPTSARRRRRTSPTSSRATRRPASSAPSRRCSSASPASACW